MVAAFLAGVVAGYAIAIPVGAIAVLIIETGIRRGRSVALAAGAGAATADFAYAALAAVFGTALAPLIEPLATPLRIVAIGALVAIAWHGLRGIRAGVRAEARAEAGQGAGVVARTTGPDARATYLRFVGLTLLNPATVIYFAALILGLPPIGDGALGRVAFVVGVAGASLSWQSVLALLGSLAHRRLPPRAIVGVSIVGSLVILGFAARIALELVAH
jgi:threonine/homoserine/homoserine lactone efflux protein